MVGSYSSTKWLWISWMVKQLFPTPPPPTTTSLYSRRNCKGSLSADVLGLGTSVARSHRAQSHWRRPAVGGGACILSTPLRERRMCSERREDEASGRFASHGRLKEIGFATSNAGARQGMDATCKACSVETTGREGGRGSRRGGRGRRRDERCRRTEVRWCMYGWWVVTGESLV